jgi:uncharacterized SAM-binding protein YcdF (DUF218 family)
MYVFSKLFDLIASPSSLLLLLVVAGTLWIWRRPDSPWGRRLLFIGVGLLAAVSLTPLSDWITRPLENRFPRPDPMPRHVDGIILLGGGIATGPSVQHGVPQLNLAGDRVTTFVALARQYPDARLVFSGGNADPFVKKTPEAAVARSFFREMGLDAARIVYEPDSRNTHENALFSYRLVHPRRGETWLMVTSACDLPRAVGSFRGVGWHVIPVPSDYHVQREQWSPGLAKGLMVADWSVHEWIGLAYYRLRGWSPELFPGPRP